MIDEMTGTRNAKTPKYELSVYRDFIRDAAPYVSLVVGRKISASEADLLSDEQIRKMAVLIDERVGALNVNRPK